MDREKLFNLIRVGYSNRRIAELMGCSVRTVTNWKRQIGCRKSDLSNMITDAQLDEMVIAALGKNPNFGEKMVAGLLSSKNIFVQRERIRQSIRRVDPEGIEARSRKLLQRRQYRVPGPNSLWHIDGNHKLIRWRFIIHGGIDGYSRLPVFLRCATNNTAKTMFSAFRRGLLEYGLPMKVRSDKGGENVLVSSFILQHPLRGPDGGHFITGRSVHNQRIERFWRDVFTGCLSVYYSLFSKMEENNILDASCDIDIAALHHVFQPIINHHLDTFRMSFMNHKLRTENNKTPLQLWHSAIEDGFPIDFITQEEIDQYTQQDAGHNVPAVNVHDVIQLTENQHTELKEQFDLDVSQLQVEEDQIVYYEAAKNFISNLINP